MRFNCETDHGPVLVTAEITTTGAHVLVEWAGPERRNVAEYFFSGDILEPDGASVEETIALLVVSQFNRTDKPNPVTIVFDIAVIEANRALRLERTT